METRYGYCRCGCGQKTSIATYTYKKRNLKLGEPLQFVSGHNFIKFVGPEYKIVESGCWQWQKSINQDGYGKTNIGRRQMYAHRKYYEGKYGPVPKGYELDHLCSNRACVNPDHLEPVLPRTNVRRSRAAKLDAQQIAKIRRMHAEGISRAELAAHFGVHPGHMSHIISGRYWADIAPEVV